MAPSSKSSIVAGAGASYSLVGEKGSAGSPRSGFSVVPGQMQAGPSPFNTQPERKPATYRTSNDKYRWYLLKNLLGPLKFVLIVGGIGALLAVPLIVIDGDSIEELADRGDKDAFLAQRPRLTVYYIFTWLLVSWVGFALFFAIGTVLPYLFRFVARYVNPAHMRYWRIVRTMRWPITVSCGVTVSYAAWEVWVDANADSIVSKFVENKDAGSGLGFLGDFLIMGTLWGWAYFLEKMLILYVTIHYHYRSDLGKIERSKDMHNALIALYEASVYLYPVGTPEFKEEDTMIGNATGQEHGEHRVRATRYLSRLGVDTYGLTSFFGNFLQSDPKSHWLRPASGYAIVERALANPKSAAALGRRIWMSLVPFGKDALTAQHIAEVLGPFRKEEAEAYFKSFDEGEIGDIRLEEMEWTVAEAGRVRHNIYKSMHQADHCINTFDWLANGIIAGLIIYFLMVAYIPVLKGIQSTIQFLSFGLSFAVGQTVHHVLAGCIFVLFDHPYDVGDRIELWNNQGGPSVSLIVTRISLLYTVFRRVDNWTELQNANEHLQKCRIENVSRSGANRQAVTLSIDIHTSFKDLQFLRSELEAFLRAPENKRDFLPTLGMNIVSVGEMNRLELRAVFTHRTNWSHEPLRAARSNKFMCALLATARKVPLLRPDGATLGRAENPAHYIMLSPEAAREEAQEIQEKERAQRWDARERQPGWRELELEFERARLEREAGVRDEEAARRAVEEAERRRREEQEREAEELAARLSLAKIPELPRRGPPPREEQAASAAANAGGMATGYQAAVSSGLRALPHFR